MERDAGKEPGDELAVWQDLVARLELPLPVNPAAAPWPERENIGDGSQPGAVHAPTMPDLPVFPGIPGPAADGGDAGAQSATGQDTTGDRTSGPGPDATGPDHGRRGTGGGGRVIRPASYLRFTFLPDAGATRADNGEAADDQAGDSTPGQGASQAAGRSPAPSGYHAGEPYLDYLDYLDAEDAADRYVPPPPPQLPRPDMVARAAWAGLFGGPGFLFLATLLSWNVPGWAELAAIMAFVAGFVVLVFRLGDGPSRKDGPDQGAVV